jgi:hypothetical protein
MQDNETIKPLVFLNMATEFTKQIPRVVNGEGEVILLDRHNLQPMFKVIHHPEIGFKFPIGEEGDVYAGRLDTLLEDFSGNLWISDIKTTSLYNRDKATGEAFPRPIWAKQFDIGTQFSGYLRGVQHNTIQPIAGTVVFAIPRVKDKLRIEIIKVRRTQQALEQWESNTTKLIKQYKRDAAKVDELGLEGLKEVLPTGAYSGACTQWGVCFFHEACKWGFAPGVVNQTTIYQPWDPLAEQEEEC